MGMKSRNNILRVELTSRHRRIVKRWPIPSISDDDSHRLMDKIDRDIEEILQWEVSLVNAGYCRDCVDEPDEEKKS